MTSWWLIVVIIGIFATALIVRTRSSRPLRPPRIPPLQPGESYDTSVKLATVPNASLADLLCQRLREQGIEAFYKSTTYLTSFYGGALVNPGLPQEIWVGEHSVERARQLFPELG
jgi:hypothetical protein